MHRKIGTIHNSIAQLELKETIFDANSLIIAQEGSGKTHLASLIRQFIIDHDIPTLYLDFSNSTLESVEARFKDEHFNFLCFEESDAFDQQLDALIAEKKNIYLSIDPNFFAKTRQEKSRLSKTIQKESLLENYYYFFHEIARLNAFYTQFEDFLLYLFDLVNMKKLGLTFLTQPNSIFENQHIKLLFTNLFVGRSQTQNYYNTSDLRTLEPHQFIYQSRVDNHSLLFNDIRTDMVYIAH